MVGWLFLNSSCSTAVRRGPRRTRSGPERRGAAGLWHTGHPPDRNGCSDGSASGQDPGRDWHCCAELLQSLSGQPNEVCGAGEEEEDVVAGEERRGKDQSRCYVDFTGMKTGQG